MNRSQRNCPRQLSQPFSKKSKPREHLRSNPPHKELGFCDFFQEKKNHFFGFFEFRRYSFTVRWRMGRPFLFCTYITNYIDIETFDFWTMAPDREPWLHIGSHWFSSTEPWFTPVKKMAPHLGALALERWAGRLSIWSMLSHVNKSQHTRTLLGTPLLGNVRESFIGSISNQKYCT